MDPTPDDARSRRSSRRDERWGIALILLLAVGLRLQGLFHDLPFSFYGDELHFVKRAMALGTGDLNPHWFHKPAFLMYLLLGSYGFYFVVGRAVGMFESIEAFGAAFLVDAGPFLLIGRALVMLFGIGIVVLGYRIGSRVHGKGAARTTACFLAILPAMVAGSQIVKADVPSAFFVTAAVWAYLRMRTNGSLVWLALAGALAGASMGTKYYGIIVVPGLILAELGAHLARRGSWPVLAKRVVIVGVAFVGAFFVTSPYNFLDPLWPDSIRSRVSEISGWEALAPHRERATAAAEAAEAADAEGAEPGQAVSLAVVESPVRESAPAGGERYDPDSDVAYEPGLGAVPGAAWHFTRKLVDRRSLGAGFALLALFGAVAMLRVPEQRGSLLVLASPILVFAVFASTLAAYHTNPRQLNAIFPLFGPLIWPGAMLVSRLLRAKGRAAVVLSVGIVCGAAVPMLQLTLERNAALQKMDSRKVAYDWIVQTVPPQDLMLLDDYGPVVQPSGPAVSRLEARLDALPTREAFTAHQARALELRKAYPFADARNVDVLGHPWWLANEVPEAELQTDPGHLDMGNPLVDRIPKPLENYRAAGVRWVVTNSEARGRYYESERIGQAFPSFRRFYDELENLSPVKTFDPSKIGGKGPVVWVYDLQDG